MSHSDRLANWTAFEEAIQEEEADAVRHGFHPTGKHTAADVRRAYSEKLINQESKVVRDAENQFFTQAALQDPASAVGDIPLGEEIFNLPRGNNAADTELFSGHSSPRTLDDIHQEWQRANEEYVTFQRTLKHHHPGQGPDPMKMVLRAEKDILVALRALQDELVAALKMRGYNEYKADIEILSRGAPRQERTP
jgi:hypothetical protein